MAGLLIRRTSNTHVNSVKDLRGVWKAGDIVAIYEDWQCAENPVQGSPHILVLVPATVQQLQKFLDKKTNAQGEIHGRSSWRFDPTVLSPISRLELQNNRRVLLTLGQARAALFNKQTGLPDG